MSRGGGSKLSWPRRALGAARDLYVRSLTGCAGRLPGDAAAFGCPTFGAAPEHGFSFSASSSRRSYSVDDEDLRELIRAASQRRAAELAAAAAPAVVPRSQSVAMARIDEDQPCEFGAAAFLPRSQSCAVAGARGRVGGRSGRRVAAA